MAAAWKSKYKSLLLLLFQFCVYFAIIALCMSEKIRIISPERPHFHYYDRNVISYANMTARRYSRSNFLYYFNLHFHTKVAVHNNVSISFYIYEYRGGRYYRSFLELHYKFCDFIHKDKLFGAPMKQGKLAKECPYLPGAYNLYNMTFQQDAVPKGFPITKGRIWANITLTGTSKTIASVYTDMEIKIIDAKLKHH